MNSLVKFLRNMVFFALPLQSVRLQGLSFADVLIICLILVLLVQRKLQIPGPVLTFSVLFLSISLTSTLQSQSSLGEDFSTVALIVFCILSAFGLVQSLERLSNDNLNKFAIYFGIGNSISVFYSFVAPSIFSRPSGLTLHPNHFGMISFISSILLFNIAIFTSKASRMGYFLLGVISFFGVAQSGSRASLVGFSIWALYVLLTSEKIRGKAFYVSLTLIGVLVTSIYLKFTGSFQRLFKPTDFELESNRARILLLSEAMETLSEAPLGSGYSNLYIAHNSFLQILVCGGFLAGFLYFTFLFRILISRYKSSSDRYFQLTTGVFPSILVFWLFSNNVVDRYTWIPIAFTAIGWIRSKSGSLINNR